MLRAKREILSGARIGQGEQGSLWTTSLSGGKPESERREYRKPKSNNASLKIITSLVCINCDLRPEL